MSGWQAYRMSELCEITSSKRIFASDYVSAGVPFYRGREITEKYKGNLEVSTELFISEQKFIEIERKFGAPKPGDLLLTSVGTLGSPYVVKSGDRFYFKDGNLTWFRNLKGLDSRFLYYWLTSSLGEAELQKCTIGSSQSAFTIVLLKGMEITLPRLAEQQQIGEALSMYDEMIENNQRRIRIFEEMARSLYREWFVHFRFPGHENHPLVPSALGEIPQGWNVYRLEDVANLSWGDTNTTKAAYVEQGYDAYSASGLDGKLDHYDFEHKGVVLSAIGAQCGRTWLARGKWSCIKNTIRFFSTNAEVSNEHLFLATEGGSFWPRRGAAQPFISQGDAKRQLIIVADPTTETSFTRCVGAMLDGVAKLQDQAANLRQTRDLLLPRLLSGQIKLEAR